MDKQQAQNIIRETFENSFDKNRFIGFIKNLLNHIDEAPFIYQGNYIPEKFRQYIKSLERIGKFSDGDHTLDILIITLQKETSLERARTMQRNFIAWYLNGSRGDQLKDAALVAYVSPDHADWRFSLVKMDYKFEKTETGRVKVKEEFTPARRWSFLVGAHEKSHTAQSRLVKILANDDHAPTLKELETAFDIETVTKEFFLKYRELFIRTKEALDNVVAKDPKVKVDFDAKGVDTVNFAKKLLGQIVFLYFLQKKGWFGVGRDDNWGTGSREFLRHLFVKRHGDYQNFFNEILEPLFYEALRIDRSHDDDYYSRFNCKIPFLNGGLFDPIGNYDWEHTDIHLPNDLFSNTRKTKEGDVGDGILDVFDRYNFTVREDEPLEKEVAIDPELLGKAYEKFNAIRPDNFAEFIFAMKSGKKGEENKFNKKFGVYYTPREIVHYMCKQSLINYLYTQAESKGLSSEIQKQDIEDLIEVGELITEHEATALIKEENIKSGIQKSTEYTALLSEGIRENATEIDRWLENITVCDPAVGSGAFPVGMMNEIVRARNVLSVYLDNGDRNDYEFKRRCIEHSLYGADIDPGAVEIAKLRLWLSLVVDEEDIKNIKPLPNLDYKIVCGNSLLGVEKNLFNNQLFEELERLKPLYFDETNPTKKQAYKKQIDDLINQITNGHTEFDFEVYFSEVFHTKGGFDVVIANPPYVSTKGRDEIDKSLLKKYYGFADDLYSHFYFKSSEILKDKIGHICFISSKTFWTIQTKRNLREMLLKNKIVELYDTANPFEAMVDTCVIIVQKTNDYDNHRIIVKDGKSILMNPKRYTIEQNTYKNAPNNVFFVPSDFNMAVYNKYSAIVKSLMDKWWDKISTSRNIAQNKKELEGYRNSLRPRDITLLGLITEGGQGLATANNGKYIGVLDGTNLSKNIKKTRPQKLLDAILSKKIEELVYIKTKADAEQFLSDKNENEIRSLFDSLKEKYGRDIFGQGWLYRIVSPEEIADVDKLTEEEKLNGIKGKITFVPYDKGDKEGNRWYAPTPYYIDWSQDKVKFLKKNSGKKGQGMPVVRNPQFYFREGFCWTDVNSTYLKSRIKDTGIYDVLTMSLFSVINTPDWYFVCIINSKLISEYVDDFINSTSHFQINDARQLPVILPTQEQLNEFEQIFDEAYAIQKDKFNNKISKQQAEKRLEFVQLKIDQLVYQLYGLTEEEIRIVEGDNEK
jgi:hypothetical protein